LKVQGRVFHHFIKKGLEYVQVQCYKYNRKLHMGEMAALGSVSLGLPGVGGVAGNGTSASSTPLGGIFLDDVLKLLGQESFVVEDSATPLLPNVPCCIVEFGCPFFHRIVAMDITR
jgi:hypothetical protein